MQRLRDWIDIDDIGDDQNVIIMIVMKHDNDGNYDSDLLSAIPFPQ